jgi:c-di-GMP-related signal transduction protein
MDVFLVRQPIFDRQENVFAYEILRRSHPPDSVEYSMMEPAATGTIVDAVLIAELNRITRGRKAFIQCSADSITAGPELQLPAPMMVIEVLEEVQPDDLFIESCKRLKDAGYQLTLGDFALKLENMHPILDLVDFIRIDFQELSTTEMKTNIGRAVSGEIKLLANGVETREDFKLALDAGCAYFQGDFFNQAVIISTKDIPSYKLNHLRILYELARDDLDFVALETVIKRDVSLSYKLLNCVNSVFFGVRSKVFRCWTQLWADQ